MGAFDDALSALHELIDEPISVVVQPLIAIIAGRLLEMDELVDPKDRTTQDDVFFQVGSPTNGFWLRRDRVSAVDWDDPSLLISLCDGVLIEIERG
jgi:hypothetical protein